MMAIPSRKIIAPCLMATTTLAIFHDPSRSLSPELVGRPRPMPQRAKWRLDGWQPRGERAPHSAFGTVFHACAEVFDRKRFTGVPADLATRETIELALELTWDYATDRPLWGTVADEWTCETGVKWNTAHTR